MSRTKTLEAETQEVPTSASLDLRYRFEEQRWRKLCDEIDGLGWKRAFSQSVEDREGHTARMQEIILQLRTETPYEMAALEGRRALAQSNEIRTESQTKRRKADEYEQRADDAESKLSDIVDSIDRNCETSRIAALRGEAKALNEQAAAADFTNLFARMLEGPRSRIRDAQIALAKLEREWAAKSKLFDDRARVLQPGLNSQAEYEQQRTSWRRQIEDAQNDYERAQNDCDLNDPVTWPPQLYSDMTVRANGILRHIAERLARVTWTQ
jgi:hypothetical protein